MLLKLMRHSLAGRMVVLRKFGHHDLRERHRPVLKADLDRLGRMQPEKKVNMAIDMTETAVGVCLNGIRAQHPSMSETKLIAELRDRLGWARRQQRRGGL